MQRSLGARLANTAAASLSELGVLGRSKPGWGAGRESHDLQRTKWPALRSLCFGDRGDASRSFSPVHRCTSCPLLAVPEVRLRSLRRRGASTHSLLSGSQRGLEPLALQKERGSGYT